MSEKRVKNSDPFLSVKEAAEYCNVSADLIYDRIWRNEIVFKRIGKLIRIRMSALTEWINSKDQAV